MQTEGFKRPLLIGVTGNIGSGKSSFCAYLEELGLKIWYADIIAKEVLGQADILEALILRWGKGVASNGVPVPERIAERVFANPEELAFLNSLVHPGTLKRMQFLVETGTSPVLVFEVPLLFEAGLEDCFDYLVLISATPQLRSTRLQKRDRESAEQIQRRLASQLPDAEKASRSDLVINNEGSLSDLRKHALQLAGRISTLGQRNVRSFA